jgi:cytochrome P450
LRKDAPVTDFDTTDFFTDPSLVPDPHPCFDYLRAKGPVARESHHGVVAVTGYDEAMALYKDIDSFSSCVAVGGPFPPLPFEPSGDDISDLIEQHRTKLALHEHMVTMDRPDHTRARSVLSRLLTPARLKENQDFLWTLADGQLDEFVERGECEFLAQYSKP